MFVTTLTIISFFSVGFCKLYEDVTALPSLEYDFVVIGGMSLRFTSIYQIRTRPQVARRGTSWRVA
jgi:hypothetical protein